MLDNIIELIVFFFVDVKSYNNKYCIIGVGVMGLVDWLVKCCLNYDELVDINCLFEEIGYWCI